MVIIRTNKRITVISLVIIGIFILISAVFEFEWYKIIIDLPNCYKLKHSDYIINISLGIVTGAIFSFITAFIEYSLAYNSIYINIKTHLFSLISNFAIIKSLNNSYKDVEELKKYLTDFYLNCKSIYYNSCDFYPITYKTKKGKLLLSLHKLIFDFYFELFKDLIHIDEYNEEELKKLISKSLTVIKKYESDFKGISENFSKIEKDSYKKIKKNAKENDLNGYKHKW